MALAALRNLRAVVPDVIAVVAPGSTRLASLLAEAGARVTECPNADHGMGASLAWGVAATVSADKWIIALADMPFILPQTIAAVTRALDEGALAAAPFYGDRRGHPVGFGSVLRDELLALDGDEGARAVLARHAAALVRVACDDSAILRDIDVPADLGD
jgi:molybdenum cofactor cytidylyltransferase